MSPDGRDVLTRWRPRRGGIIGLYEYADQVFDFAGGRLLLRGHNTSGKTKALELLFPFCLDGDISPKKLDPFGAGYKDMKWNLVGCTGREKQVGYVWLEFERLDERGAAQRLTAGIGMRGHQQQSDVPRWFFIARNRAVGDDLSLLNGRNPISKAELAAALGDDGEVLDSQRDYRARLNDLLFGFTGEDQYQTMLRLMRDLRRPHLSKTLDPDRVAAQLTVGLPEVDEGLMRKLAGGLEQLETLERGLERLRDVRERVRRFHQRTYSAYARAVIRERADALRQAHTAVDHAAEVVRATQAKLAAERARADEATERRDGADADLTRLSAERDALVSSEAWSSVAEIEALREHAATQSRAAASARERADGAAADAGGLEAELITAEAATTERREQAGAELNLAKALAERAGLGPRTEILAQQLRDGAVTADTWTRLVRELATDWRDVLHRHRALLVAARQASAAAERARQHERETAERREQMAQRRAACEHELENGRAAISVELSRWRGALEELAVDDETFEAAVGLAHAGKPPTPALAAPAEQRRTELATERAGHAAARAAAAEAVEETEAEITRLQAAEEDGPPAPAWTRAERTGRQGAPLWQLVDFCDELSAEQRSGLEAALEASGLLDAWVTPTGQLEDAAVADVVLTGAPPAGGRSLLAALTPVANQPVATEVVGQLLAGIGLGSRPSGPWVELDGRFDLGPLSGRGVKPQAEHIGAAARAARRAARVAELRIRIESLQAKIDRHDEQIAELGRRRRTLEAELSALPPVDAIAAAVDALRVTTALEAEASRAHEQASIAAREAADAELAADAARREHGAAHGLHGALGEAALDERRDAAAELAGAAGSVGGVWALAEREAHAAAVLAERLAEARHRTTEAGRRADAEAAQATRLTAEHAERERALGATGEELRRRHAEVVAALKATRETHRDAAETAQRALIEVAGLERDERTCAAEHELARSRREQASLAFRQLAQAGILQLALRETTPADAATAGTWTATRTLEVARGLPPELLAVRTGSGEQAVEVQRAVQLLDRELAEADMAAYATRGEDGLLLVRVTDAGGEQTLTQMLETLSAEIADREQILTAEERRVFTDALVEEIADHLRQRIHEVRGRVERMNAVLHRSPTAAGKTVELEWRPLEHDEGTQQTALALLRRDVRHLGEEARGQLVAFFRAKIDTARREHAFAGQPQPMVDTLMGAFDYRAWFAFGMHERGPDGRVRLTKRRHAVGSGGEQSVLIHLPLFAAAAALYGDSQAPRLIMLDEALSGIDDETRERVLEATVAFDLDVVMTSHELWGTYRSVPQLAIYQLHRENGTFGVHAIPFLWDGDVLHELEQGELLV
ncbi:MAG TPA: TIGR02680 family protein [Solirubrobacteraceae bacterium]|nr:TIGR02680 family protein [Solirubrobacteraceae bacterium]